MFPHLERDSLLVDETHPPKKKSPMVVARKKNPCKMEHLYRLWQQVGDSLMLPTGAMGHARRNDARFHPWCTTTFQSLPKIFMFSTEGKSSVF